MKKKDYEKPTIQIVKLQQQSIICTSSEQTGVQDYDVQEEQNW